MSQQRPSFLTGDNKAAPDKDRDSALRKPVEPSRPFSSLRSQTGAGGLTGSTAADSPFRSSFGSQAGGSSFGSQAGGSSFGSQAGGFSSGLRTTAQSGGQTSSADSRFSSFARSGAPASGNPFAGSSSQATPASPFRSSFGQQQSSAGGGSPIGGARSSLAATGSRPAQDGARPGIGATFRPAGQTTQQAPAASPFRTQGGLGGLRTPSPTMAFRPAPGAGAQGSGTSTPFRKDLQISDEEFLQLRDFIYQVCGIFIAENRKYLVENRLSNRIKELNLKSYSEYYNYLRYDNSRKEELNRLFEVVTTNETSFFRNPPQLKVFQDCVLKEVIDECRKSGRKRLRIWSAGCSTGEEPYTLAIILHEVLKSEIHSWDIKITANDLSEAVLSAARRGFYNEYALRTTPPEIVQAYFTKDGNVYKIKPELKQLVSFGQINLSDKDQLRRVEKSQIVFCRNVIIYFDDEMKRKVISAFYDNLEPNGMLLIGHSESLHNISRAFKPEHHTGTIVYRKMS